MKKGKIGLMLGLAVPLIALSGCAPSGEEVLSEQESQVIEISTAEELLAAAERINESGYLQQNDTYLLTADIDLTGVEWTPIGFNKRVLTLSLIHISISSQSSRCSPRVLIRQCPA